MSGDKTAIVILDALRKDHGDRYVWPKLRAYGFQRHDNAVAPAPWTLPTHASVLTGVYPVYHGAHHTRTGPRPIAPAARQLLITKKRKMGLITGNGLLSPEFGFTGFGYKKYTCTVFLPPDENVEGIAQRVFSQSGATTKIQKFLALLRAGAFSVAVRKAAHNIRQTLRMLGWEIYTLARGIPWPLEKDVDATLEAIRALPDNIDALLINLSETHEPYYRWEFLDPNYVQRIYTAKINKKRWKRGYARATRYLAKRLPEVIDALVEKDFRRIIITSDHGQLLGEHGVFGHDHFLFDELVRVPLYTLDIEVTENGTDGGWISLVDLKSAVLHGHIAERHTVFSESYKTRQIREGRAHIVFRYRIKVFSGDETAVFDVNAWKWYTDDFTKTAPPEDVIESLKGEVLHFLRTRITKLETRRTGLIG